MWSHVVMRRYSLDGKKQAVVLHMLCSSTVQEEALTAFDNHSGEFFDISLVVHVLSVCRPPLCISSLCIPYRDVACLPWFDTVVPNFSTSFFSPDAAVVQNRFFPAVNRIWKIDAASSTATTSIALFQIDWKRK